MRRFLFALRILSLSLTSTFLLGAAATDLDSASSTQALGLPTTDSDQPARAVEGCLASVDDAFILAASDGKTYRVTGDVAQLTARAGNTVRLWGHQDKVGEAEWMIAGGAHALFSAERALVISAGCPK